MFTLIEEPMFQAGDTDEFGNVIPAGSTIVYEFLWNEKVIYVGETKDFLKRMREHWSNHVRGAKSRFYNKIRKALKENYEITVRIVTKCAERNTYEITRICAQRSPHLCNGTKGGDGIELTGPAKKKWLKAQREMLRLRNADPVFRAAFTERMKLQHADPVLKAAHSERMKLQNADPVFKVAHAKRNADPVLKATHVERLKHQHADPVFKAAHAESMKIRHADPVFKASLTERMKLQNADPAFKAKRLAGIEKKKKEKENVNQTQQCDQSRPD